MLGLCCDGKTCEFKKIDEKCLEKTECSKAATCRGNSSKCPPPVPESNYVECDGNSSLCVNGSCSGKSVCLKFGLKSCFCEKNHKDECKICCINNGHCLPVDNIPKVCSFINIFL